jgi:hypothetical protein
MYVCMYVCTYVCIYITIMILNVCTFHMFELTARTSFVNHKSNKNEKIFSSFCV